MKGLHVISFILVIIGGLNWLLVGFGWNLVTMIFGSVPLLVTIIYVLIGIAAIIELVTHGKNCRMCSMKSGMKPNTPAQPAM